MRTLSARILFGAGWGQGRFLRFRRGLHWGGILGITLILGLTALVGTIIPLLIQHPDRIVQPAGLNLIVGLALMLLGLGLLGLAGQKNASPTWA